MPTPPSSTPMTLRMKLALAGAALLCLAGLAAFWQASQLARQSPPASDVRQVTVTIRDKACHPNDITVPAGRTAFTIVNQSDRALEWEILDGVMVVDERENIAPGFSQTLTVKLQPGTYAITCGLLSNPRGVLQVTPSAQSDAEAARPPITQFIGPLAEYKVTLVLTANAVVRATGQLAQAVQSGNMADIRQAYLLAHGAYKQLEPAAEQFADLDARLNARADYFAQRQSDPDFQGFYRIAHLLDTHAGVDALQAAMPALTADAATLPARVRSLQLTPDRLAQAAARQLRRTADHLPGADGMPGDPPALLDGTRKAVGKIASLLDPLLSRADPALSQTLALHLAELDQRMAAYAPPANAAALAQAMQSLADSFGQVNAALGLE